MTLAFGLDNKISGTFQGNFHKGNEREIRIIFKFSEPLIKDIHHTTHWKTFEDLDVAPFED